MTDLVIVGAGGHGRETLDVVEALEGTSGAGGAWRMRGFLDDEPSRHGTLVRGHPVLGGVEWLKAPANADVAYVLGVGSASGKARILARLRGSDERAATLVHPSASLTPHVRLGDGTVVAARALLTSDVTLGRHVYVNVGASISHDCEVGDRCHLAPGSRLAGNVRVGAGCEIGIGAVVIQGVTIGDDVIVGAGAAVIRDVPSGSTVVGVPARPIAARAAARKGD